MIQAVFGTWQAATVSTVSSNEIEQELNWVNFVVKWHFSRVLCEQTDGQTASRI